MIIINNDVARRDGESYYDYLGRLYEQRSQYNITCTDIADLMNAEFRIGNEPYGECKYRKEIRAFNAGREYERDKFSDGNRDAYAEQIADAKRELQVERAKLQTEKLENNKWLRDYARGELAMERIVQAIESCVAPEVPKPIMRTPTTREWVLAFGDAHYGKEFCIYGLNGEVINKYSPEIFEQRMWQLLDEVRSIVAKEKIKKLNVYDLGDFEEGILRVGSLIHLKYGVIEGAVRYANFLATWLNELSKCTNVKFQTCNGNHSELRMLGQPKGTFGEENMSEVVKQILSILLKDNKNFEIEVNPTGLIYDRIAELNVLGVHGDCGDLSGAIQQFSNTYKVSIDYIIGAHMHHRKYADVGRRRGAISIKSIVGVDDFAMQCNKTSDAGAALIGFELGWGDVVHYNIVLN